MNAFKSLPIIKKYFLISTIVFFGFSLVLSVYFVAVFMDALSNSVSELTPAVVALFCALFSLVNCTVYAIFAIQYAFYPHKLKKDTKLFFVYTVLIFFMQVFVILDIMGKVQDMSDLGGKYNFYGVFSIINIIFLALCMAMFLLKLVWKIVMSEEVYQQQEAIAQSFDDNGNFDNIEFDNNSIEQNVDNQSFALENKKTKKSKDKKQPTQQDTQSYNENFSYEPFDNQSNEYDENIASFADNQPSFDNSQFEQQPINQGNYSATKTTSSTIESPTINKTVTKKTTNIKPTTTTNKSSTTKQQSIDDKKAELAQKVSAMKDKMANKTTNNSTTKATSNKNTPKKGS